VKSATPKGSTRRLGPERSAISPASTPPTRRRSSRKSICLTPASRWKRWWMSCWLR